MVRSLVLALAAASALAACETTPEPAAFGAGYGQAAAPPAFASIDLGRSGDACETMLRYSIRQGAIPASELTPINRCIPRYPRRALAAELTATCMTAFHLTAAGGVALRDTKCEVGGLAEGPHKPAWAAYATAAFGDAASTAIARYRFDPAQAGGLLDKTFAVRTIFILEDMFAPPAPALPGDVVEILQRALPARS